MRQQKKKIPKNKDLENVILKLHKTHAIWVESIPVKEEFNGETVWEGNVSIFNLENHPTAKRAYAWSHTIGHSRKRKYYAVLHQGPVNSPQAAVRAAIVSDFRSKKMPIK